MPNLSSSTSHSTCEIWYHPCKFSATSKCGQSVLVTRILGKKKVTNNQHLLLNIWCGHFFPLSSPLLDSQQKENIPMHARMHELCAYGNLQSYSQMRSIHFSIQNSLGGRAQFNRMQCFIFSFQKVFIKGKTGKTIKAHERETGFFVLSLLS